MKAALVLATQVLERHPALEDPDIDVVLSGLTASLPMLAAVGV